MGKELNKIEKEGETLLVSGDVDITELDTDSLVESDEEEEESEEENNEVQYFNENISHVELSFLAVVYETKKIETEISGLLDKRNPIENKRLKVERGSEHIVKINFWAPIEKALALSLMSDFTVMELEFKYVFELYYDKNLYKRSVEIIEIDSGMALCKLILTY